jgi:hypothetical protein
MPLLYAIIFITGAAILALELLASRILTPYFGVSIFIWTGILSITLVALAAGYWAGGRRPPGSRRGISRSPPGPRCRSSPPAWSTRTHSTRSRVSTWWSVPSSPARSCCSCRCSPPRR